MEGYIYAGSFYCPNCTAIIKAELEQPEGYPDERTYDSGEYPKGPFEMGLEESDTPDRCDRCGLFLRNPLTTDGYRYVIAALQVGECDEWLDFYGSDTVYLDGKMISIREAVAV